MADLPRRWSHVGAVAELSRVFATRLEAKAGELLVAAAWAHDIGYSPRIRDTGLHAVDGARFLNGHGLPAALCNLVAFHSAALFEARELGKKDCVRDSVDEGGLVRDLLWYADMTTGPEGQSMAFEDRIAEVRGRYGPDHYVTRALDSGMPQRQAAVRRAEEWIESVGLTGQV